jgi:hypothetical protein
MHVAPDLLNLVVPGVFGERPLPGFVPEQVEAMQLAAFEQAMEEPKKLLDILVMGSHGHGTLRSVTLGSVSTRVAARCRTPLLLIRQA